ncbi:S41 family peptidase [Xiashengella succiniciproducens]|uniref:S41 family peptidase n=1 Tax=Xiashengella succiniciproducens TaxID=2949635 RepID=A0A9J6ZQ43_9BACT|nr:S41 family peptidase [Alkaliflexus sp. Ai-910]URW79797.1 S41 family peptidase [Alkaliflexus sp. Ai-910]
MSYKNSLRQVVLPLVLAAVLAGGVFIGKTFSSPGDVSPGSRLFIYPQTNKIDAVLRLIEEQYVDTVDKVELTESLIPEILKNLDPHTVYIPAEDVKEANQELEGNFGGIGVQFSIQNDTVMVISVVPGGPSEKVGIIPGDRIIAVNDSVIAGKGIDSDEVVGMLRGELGTKVKVGILRRDRKGLLDFEITRGSIPVTSVEVGYMITDSIGYVKVSRFARNTYQEFLTALARLKAYNCQNLIVDLRGNSGGYLDIAISMINEFLPKGSLIVYTEGKASPRQDVYANGLGSCKDMRLTVLIDEFSASASEIFAGAIQDNDRGLIVGRRSFGKGLVQQPFSLPDGSSIRLTVARYYTPSGRGIQKPYTNGVEDYHRDIIARFQHGEFFERDSIEFDTSLEFYTVNGRKVFGGGGVMPDVFVPRDTSGFSDYYFKIRDRALMYQFALKYSDDNRIQLQRFETVEALEHHLDKENVLARLIKYAADNGIKYDEKGFRQSKNLMGTELKAYIARNILDNMGFYPIIAQVDEILKVAVSEIQAGNDVLVFDGKNK